MTLAKALLEAQKNMPDISKDATNPHFKTKFASLDNILREIRPVLNDAGLTVTQWPSFDGISGRHTLTTRITDAASGESMEDQMFLSPGKDDMQSLGGAITYARRYALSAIFGLATDTDDDGNSTGQGKPAAGAAAKPKQTRAAAPAPSTPQYATREQRQLLFELKDANDITHEKLKEILQRVTGQQTTDKIPVDKFDAVLVELAQDEVPFA